MCKKLPSDASDFVMEAVPLLTNLLQYHDAKVRYHHVIFPLQEDISSSQAPSTLVKYQFCFFSVIFWFLCLQVLEHASICLTRIAEAFASYPEKLDELCNHGLVTQAASLISTSNSGGGQASLSTSTYTVCLNPPYVGYLQT